MSLPSFSVRNTVLVNMMMLVTLIGGGMFAFTLSREMFPESRPDKIAVMAVYPGVQPEEIQKTVTIKIEEAVHDVDGVEKVDSTVSESVSSTVLTLYNDVDDLDAVLQEVKNEVDALQDLPDDVEQVTIRKLQPSLPVIAVAVYGDGSEADRKRAARDLRDELLLLPGITHVEINGIRDDEISVEVRPDRLMEFDITFEQVAAAIRRDNVDVSGGELEGSRTTVSVRTVGEETRGVDLNDIVVVTRPDGRRIHLRDVAVIRDDFVDNNVESYFNGKPGVNVVVYEKGEQDAIQIATLVKAFVAGKQGAAFDPYGFAAAYEKPWYARPTALASAATGWAIDRGVGALVGRPNPNEVYEASLANPFDHGFEVALHTDIARFVEGRLDLLLRNGKSGLILVLISLMLFLNWRVAFWSAVGLPVSFLGTFVVMYSLGATINLLTMFGLIIVLGIIVDDAIVIGENIYRRVEEGEKPVDAAIKGAEEVMWPVVVAVSTTIAAFAPLFFVKGQIGDFMGQLPIVVLSALSVSLVEALVILPAHLAHLPSHDEMERRAAQKRGGYVQSTFARMRQLQESVIRGWLQEGYERFLRFALKWRYATVAVSLSLLMISAGLLAGRIVDWVFIQKMDSETVLCKLEMPVGTPVESVRSTLDDIDSFVVAQPEVQNVQRLVGVQFDLGGTGASGASVQPHLGQLVLELSAADAREAEGQRSSEQLMTEFRARSNELGGVNSVTWEAMSGGPGGKAIQIRITGPEFADSIAVAKELQRELETFAGVFDLDDNHDRGKRELQMRLRESARPLGITVGDLGTYVRGALYGQEARRISRNREDVRIMVRYPEDFRENPYNVESMRVPIPSTEPEGGHRWVPLREVAEVIETEGVTAIHRSQREASITVFGEIDQEVAETSEVTAALKARFEERIQPLYPTTRIEFLGEAEEMQKAFSGLNIAFPVAGLVIYLMLAGLFQSYLQPLVVMSAIPFAFFGAVVGHLVTGYPFTFLSAIGLVALMGIVVNDSLVLVDFVNSRLRSGMSPFEATVTGSKLRLRAILLTTLTTAAGLTPLMFERSFQAQFLIPMAVTLTFGLVFATALTLVIVPALNMIFFDVTQRRSRRDNDAEKVESATASPASKHVAEAVSV